MHATKKKHLFGRMYTRSGSRWNVATYSRSTMDLILGFYILYFSSLGVYRMIRISYKSYMKLTGLKAECDNIVDVEDYIIVKSA